MKTALNPYAAISDVVEAPDDLYIHVLAPIPSRSLREEYVSLRKEPALFGALRAIPRDGLRALECPKPIARAHGPRLSELGILMSPLRLPQWPRYKCSSLGGANGAFAPRAAAHGGAVRNSIARVREAAGTMLDNPAYFAGAPGTGATDPVTGLVWPYWLTPRDLRAYAAARPDASTRRGLRRERLAYVADDLASARAAWGRSCERARASLQGMGYANMRGVVPAVQVAALQRFYNGLADGGFLRFESAEGRSVVHNDLVGRTVQRLIEPLVARLAGEPIKSSYTYVSVYRRGSSLVRHTDRDQCKYTASILIDFAPRRSGRELRWPITVEPASGPVTVTQEIGDILIFRGCELPHSRPILRCASRTIHLLVHFVAKDFVGSLD